MRLLRALTLAPLLLVSLFVAPAHADEVTRWNQVLLRVATMTSPPTNPTTMARNAAIVQASVFEAINGIERRFEPIHDTGARAPAGASRRAAVVQAAYANLIRLYAAPPAAMALLEAERTSSLAAIASGEAVENSVSIERGIEWGQDAADAIWAWRSTDGFSVSGPAFNPAPVALGRWRPTPPAFGPGAGYPQISHMAPWVMNSQSQFRPVELPPALGSARYLIDFAETKEKTLITTADVLKEDDRTKLSLFWNAGTAGAYWNRAAVSFAQARHLTMSENARLLALINLSMADAAIGCWDAKYTFVYWRPITAIAVADDEDPATVEDATWTTLFATPAHPEYPSGHSCQSGAAAGVLTATFGDSTPFTLESNSIAGEFRTYPNFSAALAEVRDARVFAGIHFRRATEVGNQLGLDVANYVLENAMQPIHGRRVGQVGK
jgi:hypothetical protein